MKISKITPTLFSVTDILDDDVLQSIILEFDKYTTWTQIDWTGDGRYRYSTPYTSKLDQMSVVLTEIESIIKENIHKDVISNGAVLWCDMPGFKIPMHYDKSQHLKVSFQIYLDDGPENIGTTVQTPLGEFTVPFVRNTGYLIFYPTKQLHGVLNEVPEGMTRKSLHTSWRFATDEYSWGESNPYYDR